MLNRDAFRMTFVVGARVEQTLDLLLGLEQTLPCFSVLRLKCRLDHVAPAAVLNLRLALQLEDMRSAAVVVEVQLQPFAKHPTVHTI